MNHSSYHAQQQNNNNDDDNVTQFHLTYDYDAFYITSAAARSI